MPKNHFITLVDIYSGIAHKVHHNVTRVFTSAKVDCAAEIVTSDFLGDIQFNVYTLSQKFQSALGIGFIVTEAIFVGVVAAGAHFEVNNIASHNLFSLHERPFPGVGAVGFVCSYSLIIPQAEIASYF